MESSHRLLSNFQLNLGQALTSAAPGIKLGYTSSCPITMEAFNSTNVKLGSVTGQINMKNYGAGIAYLDLVPSSGLISYVTLKADIPTGTDGYWMIDNVELVPEPASMLVLAAGIASLMARRRRSI